MCYLHIKGIQHNFLLFNGHEINFSFNKKLWKNSYRILEKLQHNMCTHTHTQRHLSHTDMKKREVLTTTSNITIDVRNYKLSMSQLTLVDQEHEQFRILGIEELRYFKSCDYRSFIKRSALLVFVCFETKSHNMTQAITLSWAIIPELGKLRQGDHEFETSLDYIVRFSRKNSSSKKAKNEKKKETFSIDCGQRLPFNFQSFHQQCKKWQISNPMLESSLEGIVLTGHRPTRLLCGWLFSVHSNPPTGYLSACWSRWAGTWIYSLAKLHSWRVTQRSGLETFTLLLKTLKTELSGKDFKCRINFN